MSDFFSGSSCPPPIPSCPAATVPRSLPCQRPDAGPPHPSQTPHSSPQFSMQSCLPTSVSVAIFSEDGPATAAVPQPTSSPPTVRDTPPDTTDVDPGPATAVHPDPSNDLDIASTTFVIAAPSVIAGGTLVMRLSILLVYLCTVFVGSRCGVARIGSLDELQCVRGWCVLVAPFSSLHFLVYVPSIEVVSYPTPTPPTPLLCRQLVRSVPESPNAWTHASKDVDLGRLGAEANDDPWTPLTTNKKKKKDVYAAELVDFFKSSPSPITVVVARSTTLHTDVPSQDNIGVLPVDIPGRDPATSECGNRGRAKLTRPTTHSNDVITQSESTLLSAFQTAVGLSVAAALSIFVAAANLLSGGRLWGKRQLLRRLIEKYVVLGTFFVVRCCCAETMTGAAADVTHGRLLTTSTVLTQNFLGTYTSAVAGDTAYLTPSTTAYTGSCTGSADTVITSLCMKKAMTIKCAAGTASGTCTFDGLNYKRVVIVETGTTMTTAFEGITFTNGYAQGGELYTPYQGGGMYIGSSTVTATFCTFSSNTAWGSNGGAGGGMYIHSSTVTATSSSFSSNSAYYNGYGGGMYIYSSTVTATSITFSSNYAGSKGGGIFVASGTVTLYGCSFSASSPVDISGFVTIHSTCPFAGYVLSATQGAALVYNLRDGPKPTLPFSYTCNVCSAGTFKSSVMSVCTACDIGRYLSDPATFPSFHDEDSDCSVCGAGSYSASAGTATCSVCTAGKYLSDPGTLAALHDDITDCDLCSAGKYLTDSATLVASHDSVDDCLSCEPGKYSTTVGSASPCSLCVGPSITSTQAQTSCIPCSGGNLANAEKTACLSSTSCGIGIGLSDDGGACQLCPLGKYKGVVAAAQCTSCEAGKTTELTGQSSISDCTSCIEGKYNESGLGGPCTDCAAGKANANLGSTSASACVNCAVGKFSSNLGSNNCLTCSVGKYTEFPGLVTCNLCANGKTVEDDGVDPSAHVTCSFCAPGKYANFPSLCATCPVGTSNPNPGGSTTDVCAPCAAGQENSVDSITCVSCTAGKYNPTSGNSCIKCGVGKYVSSPGNTNEMSCLTCDAGTSTNNNDGSSSCTDCAAGKAAPSSGFNECDLCVGGTFAPLTKSKKCEACEIGKYADRIGMTSCTPCALGTFTFSTGSISCPLCNGGEYGVGCLKCAAGTYSTPGSPTCSLCPVGFVSSGGQGNCDYCGPGKFASSLTNACELCSPSFYSVGGAASCIKCDANTFSKASSATVCKFCTSGQVPNASQTDCDQCTAGRFSTIGDSACSDCSAGKYATLGASVCQLCTAGTRSGSKAETCVECASGYFSAAGHENCSPCSTGSVSAQGQGNCDYCGPGRYAKMSTQTCEGCEANHFSVGGSIVCAACSNGSHSLEASATCSSCLPGKYYESTLKTGDQCVYCVAGKYSANGAASETGCLACTDVGSYSRLGSAYCSTVRAGHKALKLYRNGTEICPANTFSEGASDECTTCGVGHSATGSAGCSTCGPGKYYDQSSADGLCAMCDPGTYAENGGASIFDCLACAPGFISEKGQGYCSPCPQYQNTTGSDRTKCTCDSGFDQDPAHTSACTCGPGKMLIGLSCESCAVGKFKIDFGIQSCTLCDKVRTGSTTLRENSNDPSYCQCPKDTYLVQNKYCESAVEGMNATSFGQTLQDVTLMAGFWRISNNTADVRKCPVSEACVGGDDSTEYCREGHKGPYCNLCASGYSKDVFKLCRECQTTTRNVVGTVLIIVSFCVVVFALSVLQKKLRHNGKFNAATKAVKCALKILFVTYQILATLPSIVPRMRLPANFNTFLVSIQFTNLNLFEMISVGCLTTSFNFYTMLLSATIFPLSLIGILILVGLSLPKLRAQCFTFALGVSYVILPTVTTVVFGALPCDKFEYEGATLSFLRADYSISCDGASYQTFKLYAGLMIVLIPLGIPATYAFILWRRRELIKQSIEDREKNEALMTVAFLFDSYKPEYWWFEIFETCRRLALTGALGAIKPGTITQLAAGMLISLCGIMFYCLTLPYINKRDSYLQILSNLQIFLVMLSALVLEYRPAGTGDSIDEKGLGVFLILLNVIGGLTLVLIGAFKFIIPRSEEETMKKSTSILDVFIGRGRKQKLGDASSKRGKEEPNSEQDHVGIELGSIRKSSTDDSNFKHSDNPMRKGKGGGMEKEKGLVSEDFENIGVPLPPSDWEGKQR